MSVYVASPSNFGSKVAATCFDGMNSIDSPKSMRFIMMKSVMVLAHKNFFSAFKQQTTFRLAAVNGMC